MFGGVALVLSRGAAPAIPAAGTWGTGASDWIVLASAGLLGLRLALCGRLLRRMNEVRLAFSQMLVSLPLFAAGALAWEKIHWEQIGAAPIAGILYQGFVVARVLLGMAILGERLSTGLLGGMALVALGLVLIARRARSAGSIILAHQARFIERISVTAPPFFRLPVRL